MNNQSPVVEAFLQAWAPPATTQVDHAELRERIEDAGITPSLERMRAVVIMTACAQAWLYAAHGAADDMVTGITKGWDQPSVVLDIPVKKWASTAARVMRGIGDVPGGQDIAMAVEDAVKGVARMMRVKRPPWVRNEHREAVRAAQVSAMQQIIEAAVAAMR